ncbi:MAG: acyl-CoA dehydrogenase family protein [Actinobacteria bacterium]|nr:acyl-CoA dehydrogenase family protein [Actinomycetota bacterium]MCB9388280.1 acyl-CoA dehydrogenase family protein [Acidimicrobiia bacterium]
MDLRFTESEAAFRAECRTWLEDNVPTQSLPSGDTAAGFAAHVEWERQLFDARWAVVSWPREYGGREASLVEWLIFEEEYYRANAPQRVTQNGIFLLAPTLFEYGTQEQQDRILPAMASAQTTWAQAWSEPNSGSDLASLTSRATQTSGGWLLNGQKTWCTRGAFCDFGFGLFRSDPDAQRHRGLTYFMFDLRADGVEVRPVARLDGDDGFAEVFLDDVFVPDDMVIGAVNDGWRVAMATASSERGLTLRSPGRFMATTDRLIALAARRTAANPTLGGHCSPGERSEGAGEGAGAVGGPHAAGGAGVLGQPAASGAIADGLIDDVVRAWVDARAYRWYTYGTVARMGRGESMGSEASLNKIFWSELDIRAHEAALALLGTDAELTEDPSTTDPDDWMKGYQFSLAGPIYAGTNEIQRNVVAERVLGLPRK